MPQTETGMNTPFQSMVPIAASSALHEEIAQLALLVVYLTENKQINYATEPNLSPELASLFHRHARLNPRGRRFLPSPVLLYIHV
jgi:hypothetical protein